MPLSRSPRRVANPVRRMDNRFTTGNFANHPYQPTEYQATIAPAPCPYPEDIDEETADEKMMLRQLLKQNKHIHS
ncbi:unnamed protein product, partial [Allacma fusca]